MKNYIIATLIISTTLNLNCKTQQKQENINNNSAKLQKEQKIEKIELTEQTRGINRIITFTPSSKTVSLNGSHTKAELTSSEWENINKTAGSLDLSKISSYQAPTTGRFSDRALASTIAITSNGTTYTSASFDAGTPPKELEGLYILLQDKSKKRVSRTPIPTTR